MEDATGKRPSVPSNILNGATINAGRTAPDNTSGTQNQQEKAVAYAKKGALLAILSGIIFSFNSIVLKHSEGFYPFNCNELMLLVPFICVGVHDFTASLFVTWRNFKGGYMPELRRSLLSKPGRRVILGACIGSICGMGGYMTALRFIDPAYVLPITSLYPAVAAVLAVFVLKERISTRAWLGLGFCVFGAVVIGYSPPNVEVNSHLFYWGLFFAVLASVGWGAEGVCATSGMDFILPPLALNIYYMVSSFLYLCIFIPLMSCIVLPQAGGWSILADFASSKGILFIMLGGLIGTFSYLAWYRAMNMTGVSRAMALNISYALWGLLFSIVFTDTTVTGNLIIGAIVIFVGMFLVIGNPKDMLDLRKK